MIRWKDKVYQTTQQPRAHGSQYLRKLHKHHQSYRWKFEKRHVDSQQVDILCEN
jgi:hypothetical protein